ncbi:hypothetical protein ACRAWD_16845 [Caulobacter segnis]
MAIPARHFWNPVVLDKYAAGAIKHSAYAEGRSGDWWWTGDSDQIGAFWLSYASSLVARLAAEADGAASPGRRVVRRQPRHWSVAFHFNKGLAGADAKALTASRDTAMKTRRCWTPLPWRSSPTAAGPAFVGMAEH